MVGIKTYCTIYRDRLYEFLVTQVNILSLNLAPEGFLNKVNESRLNLRILRQAHAEEPARGKLKIFLGYAAGVGKTYAMLEAAHQRQQQGLDVVIGYIETHDRMDTETLLHGLEIIPRRQVEFKDIQLPELNTDEVIKRHPELVWLMNLLIQSPVQGTQSDIWC